jgi:hypothetical protein
MRLTWLVPIGLLVACGDNFHPEEDQLSVESGESDGDTGEAPGTTPRALDVAIQIFPDSCETPLVHYEAFGTYDGDNTPLTNISCLWNFDDGSQSTACSGSHTFPEAGWHDFALRVIDFDTGASGSTTQRRFVEFPLEASLDVRSSGLTISWVVDINVLAFAIVRVEPSDKVIAADPDYGLNREYTVEVTEPGTYTVTLDVEDERGGGPICNAQITKQVTVVCADEGTVHLKARNAGRAAAPRVSVAA